MTLEWTNDHANNMADSNNPLWSYEWLKYGTCSNLEHEFDYFSQALTWHQEFAIFKHLQHFGILPGFDHDIALIVKALDVALKGKKPALNCLKLSNFDHPIISMVGICFDKTHFKIMDCPPSVHPKGLLGNCPESGLVFYPREERNYRVVEFVGLILAFALSGLIVFWLFWILCKCQKSSLDTDIINNSQENLLESTNAAEA